MNFSGLPAPYIPQELFGLEAVDPLDQASFAITRAKAAMSRGDGRGVLKHTADAMTAAGRAMDTEPEAAMEILTEAKRIAHLMTMKAVPMVSGSRGRVWAAKDSIGRAIDEFQKLDFDEAEGHLRKAHYMAQKAEVEAELARDHETQSIARQLMAVTNELLVTSRSVRSMPMSMMLFASTRMAASAGDTLREMGLGDFGQGFTGDFSFISDSAPHSPLLDFTSREQFKGLSDRTKLFLLTRSKLLTDPDFLNIKNYQIQKTIVFSMIRPMGGSHEIVPIISGHWPNSRYLDNVKRLVKAHWDDFEPLRAAALEEHTGILRSWAHGLGDDIPHTPSPMRWQTAARGGSAESAARVKISKAYDSFQEAISTLLSAKRDSLKLLNALIRTRMFAEEAPALDPNYQDSATGLKSASRLVQNAFAAHFY